MTLLQRTSIFAGGDPSRTLQLHPRAPRELIEETYWLLTSRLREKPYTAEVRAQLDALNRAYASLSEANGIGAASVVRAQAVPLWPDSGGARTAAFEARDHYERLRIARHADGAVVDLAYSVMARRLGRTDPGDEALREELHGIWQRLRDPLQRELYDAGLRHTVSTGDEDTADRTGRTNGAPSRPASPSAATEPTRVDAEQLTLWEEDTPVIEAGGVRQADPDAPPQFLRVVEKHEATAGLSRDVLVRREILPLRGRNGAREFAVGSTGEVEHTLALLAREGIDAKVTVRDREEIQRGLVDLLRTQDRYDIVFAHADRAPDLSARKVVTAPQIAVGIALLVAVAAALVLAPRATLIGVVAAVTAVYLVSTIFKFALTFRALSQPCEIAIDPRALAALEDTSLPVYTVLLPLYREPEVLTELVSAIERMDYPGDKLDVKLLLEEDDIETQAVAAQIQLPSYFQILIVPPDGPRGKPKACNYGLGFARGEYVVLYDAEDRPEPDQLKKAIVGFRTAGPLVSCLQAKLNYYNPDQNLLTKLFTIEYSTWFDLYLPALNSMRAPIALGGTSNHFRVDVLRRIGGWDPFNVTEDADLGIRLARYKFRTGVFDSVTYEEANSRLGNWIRQRSRWIKGYMLTWLVHMRNPALLVRQLGVGGFIAFQAMVFGTFFTYFVNPLLWFLVVLWYATRWSGIHTLYPTPLLYISTVALFGGNFLFMFTAVSGSLRRDNYHGVKYALLSPLYWLLMSVAAWKALHQLLSNPYYWEKTQHGLAPHSAGN